MASAEPETTAAALSRLGVERSTGALEVSGPAGAPPGGPPDGRIYLVDGGVAYAEANAVPGVAVRLERAGLCPAPRWRSLARALDAGRGGDALVDLSRTAAVPEDTLERIVRSATADAAVCLLGEASRGRCRFHPGLGRWTGWAPRTAVGDLLDQAAAGLRLLAGSRIGPDDSVALVPVGHPGVVLAPPLAAVLVGLAEGATPRQAAWQSGLAVLDAVAALSDLADQGACMVTTRRPRPDAPAPPAALPPLVARRRPQTVQPRSGQEPRLATADLGVLTRLVEGLRPR